MLTVEGDVSQPATADRIVTGALERFGRIGRIDTMVNNAGVFTGKPFTDYTIDDYQLVVRVNLRASTAPERWPLSPAGST